MNNRTAFPLSHVASLCLVLLLCKECEKVAAGDRNKPMPWMHMSSSSLHTLVASNAHFLDNHCCPSVSRVSPSMLQAVTTCPRGPCVNILAAVLCSTHVIPVLSSPRPEMDDLNRARQSSSPAT